MDPDVKSVLTASVAANLCPTVLGQVSIKDETFLFYELIIIANNELHNFQQVFSRHAK